MKRFKYFFIMVSLVIFAAPEIASAYEPAVQWEKTFGGSNVDAGHSVQQTSDGGYVIVGWTFSFGDGDVYLIKTDSSGNSQWQRTFGGSFWEQGLSVQQTKDGGYIITGDTDEGEWLTDVYLIKTDSDGNSVWQKTFGGGYDDTGYAVQQTSDGGYIIAGGIIPVDELYSDVYLIKTDTDGNSVWQKTFGGSDVDYGYSVQQTIDGGYITTGETRSFGAGDADVYLIKTDSDGNSVWQKTFGGGGVDWGYSVRQTSDTGYVIIGGTSSFGEGNVYLIKTDSKGNQEWQKTFGGNLDESGYSVQQTADGGYILGGETRSFGTGTFDVYLVKTDPNGNQEWQKTFGGNGHDAAYSIQKTVDDGYIIAGLTYSFGAGESDVYLIKLSSEVCQYELFGDVNSDCKFDFYDFALMAANWLIDCNINPADPACIPK